MNKVRTPTFGELLDLFDLGLSFFSLESIGRVGKEFLVGGIATVVWNTIVILAGEQTGGKRRPDLYIKSGKSSEEKVMTDGSAETIFLVERLIFNLEALTVEGVVLALFSARTDQVQLVGDSPSFLNLLG